MKKSSLLFLILLLSVEVSFAQTLSNKAGSAPLMTKIANPGGKATYDIKCTFKETLNDSLKTIIRSLESWLVTGTDEKFAVTKVRTGLGREVILSGDWDPFDDLTVVFDNQTALSVNTESIPGTATKWGFGKGKAFDLSANRIANQKAEYAFTHDFNVKLAEAYSSIRRGKIWVRSFSANINSTGTFASDDAVRNGTQSSFDLAVNPFYLAGGLVYRSEFSASYQIETAMNKAEDKLFDVINKQFKVGAEIEVPYTNKPIFKLHTVTGYARLAMPLTFKFDLLRKGKDGNGNDTSGRFDFKALYELAFSPFLIVKGEWHLSKFYDPPENINDTATYYSITIGQDLDAVKKALGFLTFLLGSSEDIRGKNFIFLKVSRGKKAPAFQDMKETSIGFGTYF